MSIAKSNFIEKKFKEEMGKRFKVFRNELEISQKDLSEKFSTSQSAIANIERGAVYPGLLILLYSINEYRLNPLWLITGRGDMFLQAEALADGIERISLDERYIELINLMKHPDIENIMFSKLREMKLILKDEIREMGLTKKHPDK